MRSWSRLILALALTFLGTCTAAHAEDAFVIKPYLQLGDVPTSTTGDLALLWAGDDSDATWAVDYRVGADSTWKSAEGRMIRRIALDPVPSQKLFRAKLELPPGVEFTYQVRKRGDIVFKASAKSRKAAGQHYRFVAVGDIAQGTGAQKAIALRMVLEKPDFLMVTGDIVYGRGLVSEYRDRFWPVYNADESSPTVGGPLLRSTLTLAAPGNHDIGTRNFERYPDSLAYFLYWDQPLNGPTQGPFTLPLVGPEARTKAFLDAAGPAYPRMANFSFDYGNAHWLVLDANPYVDWRDPALRDWVAKDLAAARNSTWRFVSYHHPGFNSSRAHFEQQEMRLVADLLEAGKVDIVFNGHVHNYQRTYPLRFVADRDPDGKMVRTRDLVPGQWSLDKSFDGKDQTKPDGVIYLVTGAGGAGLYDPVQQDQPQSWQSFTHKFFSKLHSITVVDVEGNKATIRQVSAEGVELDRFVVTH